MYNLEQEAEDMLEAMEGIVTSLNRMINQAQCKSKSTSGATRQNFNEIIDVHQDTLRTYKQAGQLIQKLKTLHEVKH